MDAIWKLNPVKIRRRFLRFGQYLGNLKTAPTPNRPTQHPQLTTRRSSTLSQHLNYRAEMR